MSKLKEKKDIKMTIFIVVVGVSLIVAAFTELFRAELKAEIIKTQPIYRKFLPLLSTSQPATVRMIPVM